MIVSLLKCDHLLSQLFNRPASTDLRRPSNTSDSEVWEVVLESEEAQRVMILPMLEPSSSLPNLPQICRIKLETKRNWKMHWIIYLFVEWISKTGFDQNWISKAHHWTDPFAWILRLSPKLSSVRMISFQLGISPETCDLFEIQLWGIQLPKAEKKPTQNWLKWNWIAGQLDNHL